LLDGTPFLTVRSTFACIVLSWSMYYEQSFVHETRPWTPYRVSIVADILSHVLLFIWTPCDMRCCSPAGVRDMSLFFALRLNVYTDTCILQDRRFPLTSCFLFNASFVLYRKWDRNVIEIFSCVWVACNLPFWSLYRYSSASLVIFRFSCSKTASVVHLLLPSLKAAVGAHFIVLAQLWDK